MQKIRTIVKDAFKIDELKNFWWGQVDVDDGRLIKGNIEEVNKKYDDEKIMMDVKNLLDIYTTHDHIDDINECKNDLKQVKKFLLKYN
jgi:hypothetical protein|tara:strand:+ start:377 stop:640 length:264 start_codon:yes stop_codon:yes gene_type:complete